MTLSLWHLLHSQAATLPQLCGVDPLLHIHITLSRGEKEARRIASSKAGELEHEQSVKQGRGEHREEA